MFKFIEFEGEQAMHAGYETIASLAALKDRVKEVEPSNNYCVSDAQTGQPYTMAELIY